MNIYVGHSSSMDFERNLYAPIRESELDSHHSIVLPHEDSEEPFDSKSYFEQSCDLFIAEVSEPSTGLGIELGWAERLDIPIICFHRSGTNPSSSLEVITEDIVTYENEEELIDILKELI